MSQGESSIRVSGWGALIVRGLLAMKAVEIELVSVTLPMPDVVKALGKCLEQVDAASKERTDGQ